MNISEIERMDSAVEEAKANNRRRNDILNTIDYIKAGNKPRVEIGFADESDFLFIDVEESLIMALLQDELVKAEQRIRDFKWPSST